MRRAELHFHLLPAVDDGPVDLDDAVELARLAVADGTSLVTVTPHVRDLLALGILGEIPARVREVQNALHAAGLPLEIRGGAELAYDDVPALGDRALDAIAQGPPNARWLLIEAPLFGGDAVAFLAATDELRRRGFGTLIGHPERCAGLMRMDGALERELAAGAVFQVNASSLIGGHGAEAQAWGIELVRSGRAHVLASDAHRVTRPPQLSAALAALVAAGIERDGLERLVAAAPRALLERGIAAPGTRAA